MSKNQNERKENKVIQCLRGAIGWLKRNANGSRLFDIHVRLLPISAFEYKSQIVNVRSKTRISTGSKNISDFPQDHTILLGFFFLHFFLIFILDRKSDVLVFSCSSAAQSLNVLSVPASEIYSRSNYLSHQYASGTMR